MRQKKNDTQCIVCKKPAVFNKVTKKQSRFCKDVDCRRKHRKFLRI